MNAGFSPSDWIRGKDEPFGWGKGSSGIPFRHQKGGPLPNGASRGLEAMGGTKKGLNQKRNIQSRPDLGLSMRGWMGDICNTEKKFSLLSYVKEGHSINLLDRGLRKPSGKEET